MKASKKAIRITDTATGGVQTYDILQSRSLTPSGMCVECAGYYEIACYSWYMRIDKNNLKVTGNLKDVDVFEDMDQYTAQIIASNKA